MASGGTRALDVLRRAGVAHRVHAYEPPASAGREGNRSPSYGADAAAALGLDPERIHKTLIARVDGQLVAAVVPVSAELDLKRLAAVVGGRRAELAEPLAAERATGYVRGGISPLGQRTALASVVEAAALAHPTIFVSAGRRGLQVELDPADLVRLLDARVAVIARQR